jgi:hypothetical protein
VARRAARASLGDHPRQRRLDMGIVVLSLESSLPTHKLLSLMPEHVSRPWASDAATWMEKGTGCDGIAADRQAE